MTARVHLRLCPRLSADVDGIALSGHALGSRKARTVLALLIVRRGRLLSVDEIADVLWPSSAPAEPAANVATLVSRLRRRVGDRVITATWCMKPGRDRQVTAVDAVSRACGRPSRRVRADRPPRSPRRGRARRYDLPLAQTHAAA